MEITSPRRKWKVGDYFIILSIPVSDWSLGKTTGSYSDGITYKVVAGAESSFNESFFDFESTSFAENKIFRIEDDKKRTFNIIFDVPLKG